MRKHTSGKCALCGAECELTFEHIPPKSAFNDKPVKGVSGEYFVASKKMPWDMSCFPYDNLQRGMGKYSLCSRCNNNTGAWYGEEYLRMTRAALRAFSENRKEPVSAFILKEFYPLRFIKQVFSMFCSINDFEDGRMIPLREFVLNKESCGLDHSKYRICMYFTESRFEKLNGVSVSIKLLETGIKAMAISEITAFPLGFLLYFDPVDDWDYKGIDITSFCDASYDRCMDIEFPLLQFEVNSWLPEDFRTKAEIEQCVAENETWVKEHEQE